MGERAGQVEKRIDRVMVTTLGALPGISDVVQVAPGICTAVRRTASGDMQRLRMCLRRTDRGLEFLIVDVEDRERWALGAPRGASVSLEEAAHLTILGARWFDLEKPRRRPPGVEWEF